MGSSSTLDRTSVQGRPELASPKHVSGASTASPESLRFPAEDGGKSLREMAQQDLDAALQLLTDRAQYITGASGAAIALRTDGEMICCASAGRSAPALGSQLQVNSGLSAESVRSRRILRCDNAEIDPRVNRESCRALGISSVVVLPLIGDEEVNGVFELFSDRAYAFAERDITALERLAEMIQTALHHAEAAKRAERIVEQGVASANKELSHKKDSEPKSALEVGAPGGTPIGEIDSKSEAASDSKISVNVAEQESELKSHEQQSEESQTAVASERLHIGSCESCDFPVSQGRKLCLDCESSKGAGATPFLSSIAVPQENWLHSNRYLIGTLLVVALTIAVLVWIR
jgi:hypothetical protein